MPRLSAVRSACWVGAVVCLFVVLSFAAACTARNADRLKDEDDIREATFRYQFLHNDSGLQGKEVVYFLAVDREAPTDLSDEFMKRFAGDKQTVKKVSQCKSDARWTKDKVTGKPGVALIVGRIKWVSGTSVEVEGGYGAGHSASLNTYFLKKDKNKWIVTRDRQDAVS